MSISIFLWASFIAAKPDEPPDFELQKKLQLISDYMTDSDNNLVDGGYQSPTLARQISVVVKPARIAPLEELVPESYLKAKRDPRGGRFDEKRKNDPPPLSKDSFAPVADFEGAKNIIFGDVSDAADLLLTILETENENPDFHVLTPDSPDLHNDRFQKYIDSKKLIPLGCNSKMLDCNRLPWARDTAPIHLSTPDRSEFKTMNVSHYGANRHGDFEEASHYYTNLLLDVSPKYNRGEQAFDIILEGGNLESDGAGTCLLTTKFLRDNWYTLVPKEMKADKTKKRSEPLVNSYSNPPEKDDLDAFPEEVIAQAKQILKKRFGCERTVFLNHQHRQLGHVDLVTTLVDAHTAIINLSATESDPDWIRRQKQNVQILLDAGFHVHAIRAPTMSSTYTNVLITNDAVYIPQYTRDAFLSASTSEELQQFSASAVLKLNQEALATYAKLFPGKKIIPFESNDTICSSGSIHCRTNPIYDGLDSTALANYESRDDSPARKRSGEACEIIPRHVNKVKELQSWLRNIKPIEKPEPRDDAIRDEMLDHKDSSKPAKDPN